MSVGERATKRPRPPVEQIRPGLWTVPVPIPNNPLGWTLVYLLDSDRGPVLVDAGWDDPDSWTALSEGVAKAGFAITDCYGVIVTHHHQDHHGLAGQVRDVSGAWVALHPADTVVVTRQRGRDDEWRLRAAAVLLEAGASEEDLAGLPHPDSIPTLDPALPNRLIADGERMDVPGWDLRALWTPGHSPGHCCFALPEHDLLLSGDHVLPSISPHIGLYREDPDLDPLGDYLGSLEKLADYDAHDVLPAHERRFSPLGPRRRALLDHHRERLDAILATLDRSPATAWQIAEEMPWNRSWEELGPMMKRTALGEARAHLRYLEHRGEITALPAAQPPQWCVEQNGKTAGQ